MGMFYFYRPCKFTVYSFEYTSQLLFNIIYCLFFELPTFCGAGFRSLRWLHNYLAKRVRQLRIPQIAFSQTRKMPPFSHIFYFAAKVACALDWVCVPRNSIWCNYNYGKSVVTELHLFKLITGTQSLNIKSKIKIGKTIRKSILSVTFVMSFIFITLLNS